MRKCPCCGKKTLLNFNSRIRPNVVICNSCSKVEGTDSWVVDESKPTKKLENYFTALRDYSDIRNYSDDTQEIEKHRQKYLKLKETRVQRYIAYVSSMDGAHPLAEYEDSNLTLAYVLGWLGKNYTQVGPSSWVSMYGDTIHIKHM